MIQMGITDGGGVRATAGSSWRHDERWPVSLFSFCFYRFITRRNMIPLSHRRHKLFPFLVYLRFLLQVSFSLVPTSQSRVYFLCHGRGHGTMGRCASLVDRQFKSRGNVQLCSLGRFFTYGWQEISGARIDTVHISNLSRHLGDCTGVEHLHILPHNFSLRRNHCLSQ